MQLRGPSIDFRKYFLAAGKIDEKITKRLLSARHH